MGQNYIDDYAPETPWTLTPTGEKVFKTDPDGVLKVRNQDQSTPLSIVFLHKKLGETTLSDAAVIDGYEITLADATGFAAGDLLVLSDPATDQVYFGRQIGAAVGNTVSLDRPLNFAYSPGTLVTRNTTNMAVNGATGIQTFGLRQGVAPGVSMEIDITRLIMVIFTGSAPSLKDFGDIEDGITNGVTLRKRGVENRTNILNFKNNGEFVSAAYFIEQIDVTRQAQDGVIGLLNFQGLGSVVRASDNEDIELIIRDDISSLEKFEITLLGSLTAE